MAGAAAQMLLLQSVFEGCIASFDMEKRRRPYHRNCGCALHGDATITSKNTRPCSKDSPCRAKVSYPVRRAWDHGSLTAAASLCSPSSSSSDACSLRGRRAQHSSSSSCRLEQSVNGRPRHQPIRT